MISRPRLVPAAGKTMLRSVEPMQSLEDSYRNNGRIDCTKNRGRVKNADFAGKNRGPGAG